MEVKNFKKAVLFSAAFCLLTPGLSCSALFTVDKTEDTVDVNPGDGVCADGTDGCSLRAAIMEANALSGSDTINVPDGIYTLTFAGAGEDLSVSGDLDLLGTVIITGTSASGTVIDAGTLDRVMHVSSGANLTLNNLTLRNGSTTGNGGGILVDGTFSATGITITSNYAGSGNGGGIYCGENASINASQIAVTENSLPTGSVPSGRGGGILLGRGCTAAIEKSLIKDNQNASVWGGGIYLDGNLSYDAPQGGELTLINSTVAGNSAGSGGGIYITGGARMYLVNNTIVYNTAGAGSGAGLSSNGASSFDLLNNIVAGNTNNNGIANTYQVSTTTSYNSFGAPGYFDRDVPFGNNITADSIDVSDVIESTLTYSTVWPAIATYKLQLDGPAVDGGNETAYASDDMFDGTRPQDGDGDGIAIADIGAFEYQVSKSSPFILYLPAITSKKK